MKETNSANVPLNLNRAKQFYTIGTRTFFDVCSWFAARYDCVQRVARKRFVKSLSIKTKYGPLFSPKK